MIDSKKFGTISVIAVILAVCGAIAMMIFGSGNTNAYVPEYADKIFNGEIISIDISADPEEWQSMLDNAMSEEYITADVTINGILFSDVGIRPKGNNSLQTVSSSDSDRYSFKIKFDEYISGQSCYGLDMLVLNNMIGDPTYMKEYTTFDMMETLGIDTPYYGYSDISVNGENWGLYFTLEAYNDSYELRVSGDENGVLYNVRSVNGMGGDRVSRDGENSDMTPPDGNFPDDKFHGNNLNENNFPDNKFLGNNLNENNFPDNKFSENNFPNNDTDDISAERPERGNFRDGENGGRGGMGAGQSGGSLVYTDDNSSSYPAIFENVVGGGTDEENYAKVIKALKALNSGENIEEYFDVDEILRYLAVHTFVVNPDSYSSEMAQNYYIYEHDGVLSILPWDYNYAWGAFHGGSASETVNFPIDTPLSGVEMSERPLISELFKNEEYLERYHGYLLTLVNEYFTNGKFNRLIAETDALIGNYVKNDATAFYSYDEYKTALEQFEIIGELRAESVAGQLAGTVPCTTDEQNKNSDKLIDASSVNMNFLGSGGGGMGGFGRKFTGNSDGNGENFFPPNFDKENNSDDDVNFPADGMPEFGGDPHDMTDRGNFRRR